MKIDCPINFFWKVGNYFYGLAIVAVPFASMELAFRYSNDYVFAMSFGVLLLPALLTLKYLSGYREWFNQNKWSTFVKSGMLFKSNLAFATVSACTLLSIHFTLGLWQLLILSFSMGIFFQNTALYKWHLINTRRS